MIISKASTAQPFENSPVCKGKSYGGTGNEIDGAIITVRGRYPTDGFLINEACRELVYVISGKGALLSPDKSHDFEQSDVVYIDKGETFAWDGDFKAFFVTTPKFDPAQHKEIEG